MNLNQSPPNQPKKTLPAEPQSENLKAIPEVHANKEESQKEIITPKKLIKQKETTQTLQKEKPQTLQNKSEVKIS